MSNSQGVQDKTKNDIAWERLFKEYSILEVVSQKGVFEIDSALINKVRESRLIAKFDHYANFPQIFKDHLWSILPISKNKYAIGYFDTYLRVEYDSGLEPTSVEFPIEIESKNVNNVKSLVQQVYQRFWCR